MPHTPGPWKVCEKPANDAWFIGSTIGQENPNGVRIADVSVLNIDYKDNARLIAAAPDLLDALEELLENGACYLSAIELDHNYDGEEWEKKARTAIAKAKGQ